MNKRIPFDPNEPSHREIVRCAVESAYDFCGPVMTRVREALIDEGIQPTSAVDGVALEFMEDLGLV